MDTTVVSLEPTSVEGILNTIATVGAMAEAEDAAVELVESLRARLGAIEAKAQERREGGFAGPRVVGLEWLDPPFAVGHWVPDQIRRAGGWDLLGQDGSPARPTTWDAVAEVDPDLLLLMPCGYHLRETVDEWAATVRPEWLADAGGDPARPADRARRLVVLLAAGPARRRRDRDAGRDLRPGGVPRPRRRRAAGRRSPDRGPSRSERAVADASPACGAAGPGRSARPTTSRAGRSSARTASARPATTRSSGSGCGRRSRRAQRRPRRRPAPADRRRGRARGRGADRRPPPCPRPIAAARRSTPSDPDLIAYYEARAPEYDDWYLRRGRYEHGPIHDAAWNAELDAAGRWLDGLPIAGRIVELAAGTGWWSPLLASKGELSMYDAAAAPLVRARERLVAHRLRAHLHVRDAWAEPEPPPADALFAGFWLSHVERARTASVPRARRPLAGSGRPDRADRLAARSPLRRRRPPGTGGRPLGPPPRRRPRVRDRRRSIARPTSSRRPSRRRASSTSMVTTTGRFFVLATATRA